MASSRKSMRKGDTSGLGGFTIIEVVLVLAIAGLIFLMVFIALPSLQRSQRDTQRRSMMADVQTKIMQYQTNNNGKLPNDGSVDAVEDGQLANMDDEWDCSRTNPNAAKCFIRNYLNGVNATENAFIDPQGWAYGLTIETLDEDEFFLDNSDYDKYMVYIEKKAKCDGERAIKSNNARDYAILYKLEGAGTYCHDNNS